MTRILIAVPLIWLLFPWMLFAQKAQSPGASQKSPAAVVTVTDADNGNDVDLPQGSTLVLRLKSNPSTGYSWAIKGDPSPLRLVKSSTHGRKGQAAGTPVIQEFRLAAVSAGMASLTLEYRRPWEYTAGPAETFAVKVNAR